MNFYTKEITVFHDELKTIMLGESAITDFAILLGGFITDPNKACYWGPVQKNLFGHIYSSDQPLRVPNANERRNCWRPVLLFSNNIKNLSLDVTEDSIFSEITYGEYPQYTVSTSLEEKLEQAYLSGTLKKTGKIYTTDSRVSNDHDTPFKALEHDEYEYKGKRYVRVGYKNIRSYTLSNGKQYDNGDNVWIEVSPLKWYFDNDMKIMISKNLIISGIRYDDGYIYYDKFKKTEMYKFLNTYFIKDMLSKQEVQRRNPYSLNFEQVSEEQIIKGAIESGVAVFLHGPSSEGKSARVRQIDPDCIIIYLRNATPDSLNGKSVYNSSNGEIIDVKPTWLKKLETRCEREPDKLHIVFFDEITNALPSIQGIAFNIILDKEVNGIWKLPNNARIVAAGNDMKDSLSANELAEPLFNRFAHVYIKTTTEGWLKWAREHNIHPAIYSYIAYKNGATLRSEYNGEKPNADPRKWEMASKMLYATGSPEMLRSLIGEEITREFVEFCKQPVITLEDVINENYNEIDIYLLDTASKYATTMELSRVGEENMEKVRKFVIDLGAEFVALFDLLWARDDEARLELIAEARLALGGRKI